MGGSAIVADVWCGAGVRDVCSPA